MENENVSRAAGYHKLADLTVSDKSMSELRGAVEAFKKVTGMDEPDAWYHLLTNTIGRDYSENVDFEYNIDAMYDYISDGSIYQSEYGLDEDGNEVWTGDGNCLFRLSRFIHMVRICTKEERAKRKQ